MSAAKVLERLAHTRQEAGPGLEPTDCPQCNKDNCAGHDVANVPRDFRRIDDGRYRMTLEGLGVQFDVDRLRRKWDELHGELSVKCTLAGAKTYGDVLSVADVNLSSQRARQERAEYLASRSRAEDLDWLGLLEEFVQRVLAAERAGQPAVVLRDVPRPGPDDSHVVDGLPLLMRHPLIVFGDGGAAKSYLALYCAGRLEQAGIRVALADWELAVDDHRERLERLFPGDLPGVRYIRCDKPLHHEVDRLRRIVADEGLRYVIFDAIAFACDGPPEAAEVAGRYFRAVRQLDVGSMHIAHVSKAEGADQKPFGSAFWHNGARSTWYVKLAEPSPGAPLSMGLYHRKANLGALRPAVGFEITFTDERTTFRRVNVADTPDLAAGLSVRHRMLHALRSGALSPELLAEEVQATADTVKRTARRYKQQFTVLEGGKLGLLERRS